MKITKSFEYEGVKGLKFGSWPFGRPKMFSHIYFIDGLLIDTGHSNMRKEVISAVSDLSVDQIFITHHHEDHTGNLTALQNYFKCPTRASSLCVDIMKHPPKISFAQWITWGKAKANFKIQGEDKLIQTQDHRFELIPIPGHAIDMVCLYEADKGWLFSADLWVNEYIKYFMRGESMKQQIESIKRVLKLDFKVLFCSHNPQFKDGKIKLNGKLQFLEDFYGRVAHLYSQGYPSQAIFRELGLEEGGVIRWLSTGELSTMNMVRSVIRDEQAGMKEL